MQIGHFVVICLGVLAGLSGSCGRAAEIPEDRPGFWDQGVVVVVGRPGWVYTYVTDLPANSVLYRPDYPDRPEAYPEWPRKRLARPMLVEKDGQMFMRDPQVEQAREQEVAAQARSVEGLWAQLWRRLGAGWQAYFPWGKSYQARNFLFIPKLDEAFADSALFRYLPPDQFWQVCAQEVILVYQADEESTRRQAIERGRHEHKLVLLVGPTPYAPTMHAVDFWQPWSVFVRDQENEEPASLIGNIPTGKRWDREFAKIKERWGEGGVEPNESGEQTKRKWRILRQVDLATGAVVEVLLDPEGEMAVPWPVGSSGARFEVWVMRWGTVQPSLVSCWSTFTSRVGEEARQTMVQLSSTGEESLVSGQSYRLSWRTDPSLGGECGLQRWEEDRVGNVLDHPQFQEVNREGDECRTANQPDGSECAALWWRPTGKEEWRLLSQYRQRITPLPRVDLAWSDLQHLPCGQALELAGRDFPLQGTIRVILKQDGHCFLVKELVGRPEWDLAVNLPDLGVSLGRATLSVEYPAPWTSRSDRPETWRVLKALDVKLVIVPDERTEELNGRVERGERVN
jgi:hypothetical protein